jgi:hypothetical protein
MIHALYTGDRDREWTFVQKHFTEREFREAFAQLLPTEILHDAALAFLHTNRIDVINFAVPMTNQYTNLKRNVLFIQRPGSNYFTMFSFMWVQPNDNGWLGRAFAGNTRTGNMPEYAILGMIEPMNEGHQQALIETWFDVDNWFDMLLIHNINTIENIINGVSSREQQDEHDAWMQPPPDFQDGVPQQPHPAPVPAWDVRILLPESIVNQIPLHRAIV